MGSFAEFLTNNQAKNINKISDKIEKKLETFNNSLTLYNKAKSSTGVATVSINPNKTKATGADTISVNPRNTSSSVKWTALAHPSPKLNKTTSSTKPSGPF